MAWIVLLASLLITFFAWYLARGVTMERAHDRFDFRVQTIESSLRARLCACEFLLRGAAGLIAASEEVTRAEWRTYVTKLQVDQYYHGIQGLGFSKRILPSEKKTHIRQIRDEGFPNYDIRPDGERPEYTAIIFLEPFDWRNQRAFGYDMFSEPTRKEAMVKARDTGLAAMSGKVTLRQETDKDVQAGALMYLPVYRKGEPQETPEQRRAALTGYVYSPFRMNDFMRGILTEKRGYVELQIFDGDEPLKEALLYHGGGPEAILSQSDRKHFATRQSILEYAGRRWLLVFESSSHFEETIDTGPVNTILLLGIITSLLLFAVVLSLTRSRNQVLSLANMSLALERANIGLREEIVERKRMEDALRQSEEIFSRFMEHSPIYVFFKDEQIRSLRLSTNFEKMLGKPLKDLLGKTMDDLFPSDLAKGMMADDLRILREGKEIVVEEELNGRLYSTIKFPIHIAGKPRYLAGYSIDITERKRAEEEKEKLQAQIQQAQKAESLGRMAGAIAHHYNNLLGVVLGNLDLALNELPRASRLQENITEAIKASRRAAEISHLMLAYLGQGMGKRETMDLSEVCRETLPLLTSFLPKKTRLRTESPAEGPIIRADAAQMKQVLTNLVVNAGEAIGEEEGDISVSIGVIPAADIHASRFYPPDWEPKADTYACLSVTDTGCGMDPETIEKLFEPFFSTKFTGRGLGLPVVMGIVKAHEGAVTVESIPGQGATFRVFLPVTAEKPLQPRKAEPVEPVAVEGRGLVLVVEDNTMLRDTAQRMLKHIGYEVIEAADGVEAVEVFRQHQEQIRCVLCDLTMPRMDGWETLEALRKIATDIPVILASGYDEALVMAGDHPEQPHVFLHKPYALADLKAALAAALKGPVRAGSF